MKKQFEFFAKNIWFDEVSLDELPDEFKKIKTSGKNYSSVKKFFLATVLPENVDDWEDFFVFANDERRSSAEIAEISGACACLASGRLVGTLYHLYALGRR